MISSSKLRGLLGISSTPERRKSIAEGRRVRLSLRPRGDVLEGRSLMAALGIDPTFGLGGTSSLPAPPNPSQSYLLSGLAIQSDGKILGVGARQTVVSSSSPPIFTNDLLVERVQSNGSLDTSFGSGGLSVISLQPGGVAIDTRGIAVAQQADGKLVVLATVDERSGTTGSTVTHQEFAVIRLTASGALDTTFNSTGYNIFSFDATLSSPDVPTSLALTSTGLIVAAGYTYNTPDGSADFAVARLTTNGVLDTSFSGDGLQTVAFNLGPTNTDQANAVVVQPDGKVVLAGSATVTSIVEHDIAVARLNADGSLDTSFDGDGKQVIAYNLGGSNDDVGNSVVLSDSTIVIGGTSRAPDSPSGSSIQNATLTRLTSAGAVASKFNLSVTQQGVTFSTYGYNLNPVVDGSLILGGYTFGVDSNVNGAFFAKFLPTGTLDSSYGSGGTAILPGASILKDAVIQPDGKLVFNGFNEIRRTTAPVPEVVSAQLLLPNTARNASSNTIVIRFNTALNQTLAGNPLSYRVRIGTRGRHFVAMRRVSYDPNTFTTTITLGKKVGRRTTLQVLATALGIAGADSLLLNGGQTTAIPVTPSV